MIYFIQQNKNGPIKIGYTANLKQRMVAIQVCNHDKLMLLGTVGGERYIEKQIHQHLRFHYIGGEWFRPSAFVLEYIYSFPGYIPNLLDRPREKNKHSLSKNTSIFKKSEKALIIKALTDCNYNKTHVAKMLSISRSTLYQKMKLYKIEDKNGRKKSCKKKK